VDAQQANLRAAEENVRQAQANLDRMLALQDFKNVRSPVTGVVTARNIDTGYLISSSGAGQGGTPIDLPGSQIASGGNEMFRVAQTKTLRILINVPQAGSPGIMIGMPVQVTVNEYPGRIFPGKVARTTASLDPNSRTMQTQIDLPNGDGKLIPGMFAQVSLRVHRDPPPLLIPGDAVIAGAGGVQVAILLDDSGREGQGKDGAKRVHLQTVQLGRDYGAQTEILGGLDGSETVVVNPGDEVREGNLVKAEVRAK
jgi:RND family efflux transporter MFP subunit